MDDDSVFRRRIARVLQARGFMVETAADGVEALEVVHEVRPHLVVTDIEMPNLDGWELVRRLRSDARTSLVPVIFLTQRSAAKDVLCGFRLGADDFLSKPVGPAELLGRVDDVLRKRAELGRRLRPALGAPPRTPSGRQSRRPDLVGSVDQLGLSTLLTVLESGERTGVIRLWRDEGDQKETGRVWLRAGKVVRAAVMGPGPGVGDDEDAIYYLLTWSRGEFSFVSSEARVPHEAVAAVPCLAPTQLLLMEGARRIDEVQHEVGSKGTDVLRRAFLRPAAGEVA